MNTRTFTLAALCCALSLTVQAQPDNRRDAVTVNPTAVQKPLLQTFNFRRSTFRVLTEPSDQAANTATEDAEPSGPSNEVSPVYLADVFEGASRHIRDDFAQHLPYADELIRDHTSLNNYYFYPTGYLLQREKHSGYALNFLYQSREEDGQEDRVLMTFTLAPRQLSGALPTLSTLAEFAIEPGNDKAVKLNRLPVADVRVEMSGLSMLIPQENIQVLNRPQFAGDEVRVQARMTQVEKESVVAALRSGGLAGEIVFTTQGGRFELVTPYLISLTEFTGDWVAEQAPQQAMQFTNVSPFPVILNGVVAYTHDATGKRMQRRYHAFSQPVRLPPGAEARNDRPLQDLFGDHGQVLMHWVLFDTERCDACLNDIEKDILVAPAVASRSDLLIESIPNVFSEHNVFKIIVQVRSQHFSSGGDLQETRQVTLKADHTSDQLSLFPDRDRPDQTQAFEYRIKYYGNDGVISAFSDWKDSEGLLDITISALDIQSLSMDGDQDEA